MSERGKAERSRWSALGKVEKAIALIGAVLALPTAAVGAWAVIAGGDDGGGTPTPTPSPTAEPAAERARHVRACERLHGMTRAEDKVRARAERHGAAFGAKATRFRSCAWPPPPGAEADGYSEFVVEQVYDPRFSEAENPIDDIWYGNCRRFAVELLAVKTGAAIPFTVRVAVGERRYLDDSRAPPGAYRDDLAPDEAVVRHSSGEVIRGVGCLEAG
jgi:hypothetical protein